MKGRMRKTPRNVSRSSLLAQAREAALNAYAPYSGFAVGAAVQTRDGRVFKGANMENASYGLTLCAEAGALQAASTAGALSQIVRIAIVGGPIHKRASTAPITPCGRCRQLIQESAMQSKTDIDVVFSDLDLKRHYSQKISTLLPRSFGAKDLPPLETWSKLQRTLKRR